MVGQVLFVIINIIIVAAIIINIIIIIIWSIFFCSSTLSGVGRQLRLDFAPPGGSALRSCSSLWRDQSGIILMVMMVVMVMVMVMMVMVMMILMIMMVMTVMVMMMKVIERSVRLVDSILNHVCHIEIIVHTNNWDGGYL